MVFYFTGTGNSLYVAKELEEKRISIPQAIHGEKMVFEADKVGVVCPLYGHEMPGMVKEFLRKAVFQTTYFLPGPDLREEAWRRGGACLGIFGFLSKTSGLHQHHYDGGQLPAGV